MLRRLALACAARHRSVSSRTGPVAPYRARRCGTRVRVAGAAVTAVGGTVLGSHLYDSVKQSREPTRVTVVHATDSEAQLQAQIERFVNDFPASFGLGLTWLSPREATLHAPHIKGRVWSDGGMVHLEVRVENHLRFYSKLLHRMFVNHLCRALNVATYY